MSRRLAHSAGQFSTLRAAQLAYDHRIPDDTPDWLETEQGATWLAEAADQLIEGIDLRISGRTVLCASALQGQKDVREAAEALVAPFARLRLQELIDDEHDFNNRGKDYD